ncbi:hypothetical protein HPULCUR_011789 [Helicostylum pulchrum]|uniref:F-box domain-containing protein n=1 Tax=Helicostylum pulchrum TaxID=562976 RepID=A0ABP9YHV9_9FUNG
MRDLPLEIFKTVFQYLEQKYVTDFVTLFPVDLNYDKSTIHLNSQHINTLDSLTKFKKLTNLSIDNKHDINLTPFQVQDSCSNLEQLKFSSDYPISENVMLRRLSNNINLDFVASLKCLELELPSLSATYTRYLVDYFPNQLIDIDITISDQSPFSWIGSVGKELALGLMEKAGRVKGSFICFQQINRYEVQPNEESNMTKYFKLLNAFRGTRQIYCEAEFTEPNEVDTTDCVFHYFSCGKLYTTYCMHDNDFHGPDNADLDLPDKTSSMIGPEIFSSLEIAIWRKNTDLMYQSLKYSFLNCPKIEGFGLNYDDSPYEQMSSYIKYTHKKESPIRSYQYSILQH